MIIMTYPDRIFYVIAKQVKYDGSMTWMGRTNVTREMFSYFVRDVVINIALHLLL